MFEFWAWIETFQPKMKTAISIREKGRRVCILFLLVGLALKYDDTTDSILLVRQNILTSEQRPYAVKRS